MKNQKILISGGSGFVGTNLAYKLMKHNEVIILDWKVDNSPNELLENPDVKFVEADVRSQTAYQLAEQADVVFHLAAQTSVPYSVQEPFEDAYNNINGAINMAHACKESGATLVFTSSAAVYGQSNAPPYDEDMTPSPISPYGLSKHTAERYIQNLLGENKYSTVRPFNIYGPHSRKGVIYGMLRALNNDKKYTINGDGNQTRDFIFIDDVVDSLIKLAKNPANGAVNLATGQQTSLNKLVDLIVNGTGKAMQTGYGPHREGDVTKNYANVIRMWSFNCKAKISLHNGLKMTYRWIKGDLDG